MATVGGRRVIVTDGKGKAMQEVEELDMGGPRIHSGPDAVEQALGDAMLHGEGALRVGPELAAQLEEAIAIVDKAGAQLEVMSSEYAGGAGGAVVFCDGSGNPTGAMNAEDYETLCRAPERHAAPMPLGDEADDAWAWAQLLSRRACLERRATHPTHGTPDDIARAVFINSHRFRAMSSFDGKVWRLSRKHNESGNAREANE